MNSNFALSKFYSTSIQNPIYNLNVIHKFILFLSVSQIWTALCFAELRAGGWEWKFGGEGGYFHAGDHYDSQRIKYISALSGYARYNYSEEGNSYLFQVRLRPELYGPQSNNYTINSSAAGQYLHRWNEFDLSAGMTVRRQNYHLHSDRLYVNMFQFFASASWYFRPNVSAEVGGQYNNALVSGNAKNTNSARSVSLRVRYALSSYGSFSAGVLVENFYAHTNDILFTSKANRGWRIGPDLNYEYSRNWMISFHYLPSKRFSHTSNEVHTEHEINIVAGKNITAQWSIFMLADYYIRDIDSSAGNPVYTQTNYENRIHAKLVYSWKKEYSVYFKLAYSKNELIHEKITLSGTQASVGFEIQK